MAKKPKRSSLFIWISVAGIIISLLLSVIPLFFNQSVAIALLIALVGLGATFLFDLSVSSREHEILLFSKIDDLQSDIATLVENEGEEIKRAIKLGEYLARDNELRGTIESIVDTCERVKSLNVDVFTRKVDDYLKDCNKRIDDLSDGKEVLKSDFSFLPSEHCPQKSVAKIVMSTEPLYLDTSYGRKTLEEQKKCIQLNRNITFIWVLEKSVLANPKFQHLVQEQKKIGVETLVANKEDVPDHLQKNYGIVDNKYFYVSSFINGKLDRDDVSNEQDKLRRLEEGFSQLRKKFAESADIYYA